MEHQDGPPPVVRCLTIFVLIPDFYEIYFNIAFMDTVGTMKKQ